MSVVKFRSFDQLFLGNKGKQNLRSLKICVQPLYIHSYKNLSRYDILLVSLVVGVTLKDPLVIGCVG